MRRQAGGGIAGCGRGGWTHGLPRSRNPPSPDSRRIFAAVVSRDDGRSRPRPSARTPAGRSPVRSAASTSGSTAGRSRTPPSPRTSPSSTTRAGRRRAPAVAAACFRARLAGEPSPARGTDGPGPRRLPADCRRSRPPPGRRRSRRRTWPPSSPPTRAGAAAASSSTSSPSIAAAPPPRRVRNEVSARRHLPRASGTASTSLPPLSRIPRWSRPGTSNLRGRTLWQRPRSCCGRTP